MELYHASQSKAEREEMETLYVKAFEQGRKTLRPTGELFVDDTKLAQKYWKEYLKKHQ